MGNIKIREANGVVSETMATGEGTPLAPKVPHFSLMDPENGLHIRIEETEYGKATFPVHAEHVHSRGYNTHFSRSLQAATTLTAEATKNTYNLTVTSAAGISVGSKIRIYTTTYREPDFASVTAVNGLILTINHRLDRTYPIGSFVEPFSLDLNVAGSMASPLYYRYSPRPGKINHVEGFVFYIRSAAEPYDSMFGGITSLTNGVHLRRYDGFTGDYQTMDVIRVNRRFWQSGYSITYGNRASPGDAYSTIARINVLDWQSSMFRLDSANGDFMEAVIQDNLSTLAGFELKVAGHEEI